MIVQIPAVIREATRDELFGLNDVPKLNALYFLKNNKSAPFFGPFAVHEGIKQAEFINWYIFRKLYVIITEGEGYCFLMNLRPGKAQDLLDGRFFRMNYTYYIKESDGILDGPHFLNNESDPISLAALVQKEALYVVSEEQSFQSYTLEKSA